MTDYAELQVTSCFSFLRGASHPDELVLTAAALGLPALAITDRNSLAGVVRAHLAARAAPVRLVIGARLDLVDGPSLLAWTIDRAGYARLSQLLTLGKRRTAKDACHLTLNDLCQTLNGLMFAAIYPAHPPGDPAGRATLLGALAALRDAHGDRLALAVSPRFAGADARRLAEAGALAATAAIDLVATNDVLYHGPARKPLHDVMTCVRHHTVIDRAGHLLGAHAERYLKSPAAVARLFRDRPDALGRAAAIADACRFSLAELSYQYPTEVDGSDETPDQRLARLTAIGATLRYPDGVPAPVSAQIARELALIGQLGFAPYFLTVHDIVRFARSRGILCQGRGSAANSAVCYCLGITAVDPALGDLLFERFVSAARNEPPDIDVDFEHDRREEVIQYVYRKYGRDHAGLTATVIRYRARSALREVGKAMGLSTDAVARLVGGMWGSPSSGLSDDEVRERGLDPSAPRLARTLALARELIGFPRHLSQHVGGFVITRGPLGDLAPILNATMPERTTIEWDKDDIDALGILKVDVLGLGMLSCINRAFALLARHHDRRVTLATVPPDDPAVYDMLCRGDSLGVFQVESRAQMAMLPRLKPRSFYDLVIEVAIVRPGPIMGDMVHPYLRRRAGLEEVTYPSEQLRQVLGKTLGVPLFQEQAMRLAIVAAGFTADEADQLRRAMATFRHVGTIHAFRDKLINGMVANGLQPGFAERCFRQIEGFGTYGFPESHAASFALLVYASAWLKCRYPAAFACALLNSQPMGFYAPAQIIADARAHGVEARPPDVNRSDWDCSLEAASDLERPALRLGLRLVKGLARGDAERLTAARAASYKGNTVVFQSIPALVSATGLGRTALGHLAAADAFGSLGLDRRRALWAIDAVSDQPLPLFQSVADAATADPAVSLPEMPLGAEVVEDYASLGMSLKAHPAALLRPVLATLGAVPAGTLARARHGRHLRVAGLVLVRQRPGTAKGVIFVTLEDETGIANLVVLPPVFARDRVPLLTSRLLAADGRLERHGTVVHVIANRLIDLSDRLAELVTTVPAVAFEQTAAHADEARPPIRDDHATVTAFPSGRNFH